MICMSKWEKKEAYRWVAKDKKTKFRLYGKLTDDKSYEVGTKQLYRSIKERCYKQFLERRYKKKIVFVSDKMENYKRGFSKFFRNVAILVFGVSIACKKYGLRYNNNCIERDHQYARQRYKIMRNFSALDSAEDLMNFMDVHYNFIDLQKLPGEKLYRSPAERAGIKLNLGKRYKLLQLIKIASTQN